MRKAILLVSLFLLAACASDQSGMQSKPVRSASMTDQAPMLSEEAFQHYIGELSKARLIDVCGDRRTISSQFGCIRDAVFRGFDTTGEAKRNCDGDAPLEDLLKCAILGSLGYQLALDAQLAQATAYNWRDPEAALQGTIESLAEKTVTDCMRVQLSRVEACIVERTGTSLLLSKQQVATCTDMGDSDRSLDCMLRVHLIQRIEMAIERMGPGAGQQV